MTTLLIRVTATARRHIVTISEWWIANRPDAPAAFVDEFDIALARLAASPFAGSIYPAGRPHEVRRVLLARSGYHVYYSVTASTILIRAVWHAARGQGPRL